MCRDETICCVECVLSLLCVSCGSFVCDRVPSAPSLCSLSCSIVPLPVPSMRRPSPTMKAVIVLMAMAIAAVSAAHPLFRHGRPRHGFVRPPVGTPAKTLPDLWMTQKLDHFDPQNNATFEMRYFMNSDYYSSGGPVFLLMGGEGTANPIWISGLQVPTQIVAWAAEFGAMLFSIEHRFYGQTQPFPDLSTANLAFLTSEQALADAAYFKDVMTAQYSLPANTPWISVGGSYSGALSGWLRLKYPHVVVGAVATSAPVFPEADFSQCTRSGALSRALRCIRLTDCHVCCVQIWR
jgi:hypothetical protein